jgi:hypothetical protein
MYIGLEMFGRWKHTMLWKLDLFLFSGETVGDPASTMLGSFRIRDKWISPEA